jgi:hypothetical protein
MGFIFKGNSLTGFALETAENFNSIPGLRLYLDSQLRVTAIGGFVKSIQDASNAGLNFTIQNFATLPITYENGIITQNNLTAGQASQFLNTQGNWNFFENGSPFAVFGFHKIKYGSAAGTVNVRSMETGFTGQPISRVIHTAATRRLVFQVLNQSGTAGQTVISVNSANNTIPDDTAYTFGVVRRTLNSTNNYRMFIDNTLIHEQSNTTVQIPSTTRNRMLIYTLPEANDHRVDWGFQVIYDWTGFTEAQVDAFVTRLRILVEQRKILYGI